MSDTGTAHTGTAPAAVAPAKRRRGRESVRDMLLSLAVVMVLVVGWWFLAQPPPGDSRALRVVDPTAEITAFATAHSGVPVPRTLPATWRATSSTLAPDRLRIGYVTPAGRYAEYDATTGPAPAFVDELTGRAPAVGSVQAGGAGWQEHRTESGALSLSRSTGGTTLVLGSLRSTAGLDELRELAGALSAG